MQIINDFSPSEFVEYKMTKITSNGRNIVEISVAQLNSRNKRFNLILYSRLWVQDVGT